ncbi:MAG: hypothetical protein BGO49_26550 [Planctomycetales bacterium 71-10]|nr:MAG: hypothetical protein BGO49_26550 [Planctomycetales bacterium 71-10]
MDRSAYVTLFGRFLNAHYGVFGKPLTRSMQAPGYRIVKAEYVTEGESRLIKVDFEVGSQDPRSTISVVFDPQDGWNIRSSDFRTGNTPGVRISTEVSYGPPRIDGFSLPSRVVSRLGSGATSTCDFTDWKFESTPEAEFKMSFYNVPDLVDVPKNRKTLYISMFVGAAAVVFAAALVFRRYGYGPAG